MALPLCVGEHAVKQLEAHLARVRLAIAETASPKSLGEAAKQEGKGLLKIAQAGLRNTTGGLGGFFHWYSSTVLRAVQQYVVSCCDDYRSITFSESSIPRILLLYSSVSASF